MTERLKERNEIEEKYKWDLTTLFSSDEEWERIFAPFFTVDHLEHFAWPGETAEKRRLFHLRKREDG